MEDKWRWVLVTAIAPIAWGSTYYVTREHLPADAPLWGAAIRALPAGLILLVIARKLPHGSWWWKSAILGVLNMSVFFVLVYLSAQLLPASIAAVVMATAPVVMMALAWLLLAETPSKWRLLGAFLGVLGVSVMLLTGNTAFSVAGVAASVGAMVMSSLGYVLSKRWATDAPLIASTSWQLVMGGLLLLPVAMMVEGAPPHLDATASLAFVYVGVVATALAFVAWFAGLRHLPAGAVSLIGLFNPVAGVVLGFAAASEVITLRQALGMALVLLGVVLGQRGQRRVIREVELVRR